MKHKISFDLELRKNPYKGIYIALEGTEASGKTTQTKALTKYFEKKGRKVIHTREPRKEGLIGDLIHKVLKGELTLNKVGFQYLVATDRTLHQEDTVVPGLEKGNIVISDRCFWSAVVYGILDKSEKYNRESVDQLLVAQSILSMYHQFIAPDFTFYLKIPVEVSLKRLKNERKQVKEIYEEGDKIKKIIDGYNFVFSEFSKSVNTIDGTKPVEEVTEEILKNFQQYVSGIKY